MTSESPLPPSKFGAGYTVGGQQHAAPPQPPFQQPIAPPLPVPAGPYAREVRLARTAHLRAVLNPVRLTFGAGALIWGVAFAVAFVTLRTDANWPYDGWLCRGWFPLVFVLVGFAYTIAGLVGVRRWTATRWIAGRRNQIGYPSQVSPSA